MKKGTKSKRTPILIDCDDVKVEPIAPRLCDSDGCNKKATHIISVDYRNAGRIATSSDVPMCKRHAEELAKHIRDAIARTVVALRTSPRKS